MPLTIDASTLKGWLSDGDEIALIDVREAGQFGQGHLFFAVPLPYSRFELGLNALVPKRDVRMVLCDGGQDAVAQRAAKRAEALGYHCVHVLSGGTAAWQRAGYTLYEGVNVPSKTFGELVEHERHTPRITAVELDAMRVAGENFVIVDGRPFGEYQKMNIPGGICCPNGELVLRIGDIAPDASTKIIVNCAGRTRSIIGAQTLIDFGVPNPVMALENGTQGWMLAGLTLEHGASRRHGDRITGNVAALAERARALGESRGVVWVEAEEAQAWTAGDALRTTYLIDVRTAEEFAASPVPGFVHAPGGQLVQATDQWIGVKGARILLVDGEGVRAPVIASWLRELGHEACVLAGGVAAAVAKPWPEIASPSPPPPNTISARELADALQHEAAALIDLRPAMSYRAGHIARARWSIRPRLVSAVVHVGKTVVLVADAPGIAALAALDLAEAGCRDIRLLAEGPQSWRGAGLSVVATPEDPPDADCIDFLFFTHGRHAGNADDARRYLAWETGLIGQLDAQERGAFRIRPGLKGQRHAQ
ncbi:MAG: sulfurtransferase [Hyphomicrobiaceae bacterium]|nr:sulfurtransferase [Hyphomicrobiaceae bacterium]